VYVARSPLRSLPDAARIVGAMKGRWLLALGVVLGCGGNAENSAGNASASASCTMTETMTFTGAPAVTFTFCSEVSGVTNDQVNAMRSTCSGNLATDGGVNLDGGVTMTGVFSTGPCSRANVIGGCTITSGGYTQTVWYYSGPGVTVDVVRSACANGGGTYIAP